MKSLLLLVFVLISASGIGIYYQRRNGVIKRKKRLRLTPTELGSGYGDRATIVQFSTTFCSSCRAAKGLIKDVVKNQSDIKYLEIDAESNLDLVRKVDIKSTPTTLFLDKDGFEIARATGAPKRDQLIKVVASLKHT
jgi:thiol-disulfide isomerase/thioredoxin